MKKLFPAMFLLILIYGCHRIIEVSYGIKKPRLEDEQSVGKYLLDNTQDISKNFYFKDLLSFVTASSNNFIDIPEASFFNNKGELVRYKPEASKCNAHVSDFIGELSNFSALPSDPRVSLQQIAILLKDGDKIQPQKADITVLITWCTYAGKLNRKKAFLWTSLLEEAKENHLRVQYFLVNCDYQRNWNIPTAAMEKLHIKG
jgi:hypothetical protein